MANCNKCDCTNNGLHTVPHCHDSYPECIIENPCDEIISDLCVLHNPNGIFAVLGTNQTLTIPTNINMYSFIQLLMMYLSPSLRNYSLDSNTYRPILNFRTLWIGERGFRLYWDFPNVPDYNLQPTQFRITINQVGATNQAVYTCPSTTNTFTVYDYGTIVYAPQTTYHAKVELIDISNLPPNTLTSSVTIIIKTK